MGLWLVSAFDAWGILSSLVLVFILWVRKELRHNYNLWLVSSAVVACLLACVFVTPVRIHESLAYKSVPHEYCGFFLVMSKIVAFMIPVSLVMVVVDRFVYIYDPIIYVRKMRRGVILAMILIPWAFAIIFGICAMFGFSVSVAQYESGRYGNMLCGIRVDQLFFVKRLEFNLTLYYVLPALLLVAAIVLLMSVVCYRRHCCVHHLPEFDFESDDTRENVCRAVLPVSIITALYLALLIPCLVISWHSGNHVGSAYTIWVLASFEWVQALLWVLLLPDVRAVVWRVICCCSEDDGSSEDLRLVRASKPMAVRY